MGFSRVLSIPSPTLACKLTNSRGCNFLSPTGTSSNRPLTFKFPPVLLCLVCWWLVGLRCRQSSIEKSIEESLAADWWCFMYEHKLGILKPHAAPGVKNYTLIFITNVTLPRLEFSVWQIPSAWKPGGCTEDVTLAAAAALYRQANMLHHFRFIGCFSRSKNVPVITPIRLH